MGGMFSFVWFSTGDPTWRSATEGCAWLVFSEGGAGSSSVLGS